MSFLLSLCMLWPGVCDIPDAGLQVRAAVVREAAGPVERWRPLVSLHFPADEIDTAMCIIQHESRGDPRAKNPKSSARGLFQILGSLWAPHYGVERAELHDPILNARLARDIWDDHGWWAWSPYQRGACR